jgi:DNA-binding MarR family transcriptional regulator
MKKESRIMGQALKAREPAVEWSFLTKHAHVLVCIAQDPGSRLREIGDAVGITERATHRIVSELVDAGYISRERKGRRNRYTVRSHLPLPDALPREQKIGDLLTILAGRHAPGLRTDKVGQDS